MMIITFLLVLEGSEKNPREHSEYVIEGKIQNLQRLAIFTPKPVIWIGGNDRMFFWGVGGGADNIGCSNQKGTHQQSRSSSFDYQKQFGSWWFPAVGLIHIGKLERLYCSCILLA